MVAKLLAAVLLWLLPGVELAQQAAGLLLGGQQPAVAAVERWPEEQSLGAARRVLTVAVIQSLAPMELMRE